MQRQGDTAAQDRGRGMMKPWDASSQDEKKPRGQHQNPTLALNLHLGFHFHPMLMMEIWSQMESTRGRDQASSCAQPAICRRKTAPASAAG